MYMVFEHVHTHVAIELCMYKVLTGACEPLLGRLMGGSWSLGLHMYVYTHTHTHTHICTLKYKLNP